LPTLPRSLAGNARPASATVSARLPSRTARTCTLPPRDCSGWRCRSGCAQQDGDDVPHGPPSAPLRLRPWSDFDLPGQGVRAPVRRRRCGRGPAGRQASGRPPGSSGINGGRASAVAQPSWVRDDRSQRLRCPAHACARRRQPNRGAPPAPGVFKPASGVRSSRAHRALKRRSFDLSCAHAEQPVEVVDQGMTSPGISPASSTPRCPDRARPPARPSAARGRSRVVRR